MTDPNTRWATPEMAAIWSRDRYAGMARHLWLLTMLAQSDQGYEIPSEALNAYTATVNGPVNWSDVELYEQSTRHETKAHQLAYDIAATQFAGIPLTRAFRWTHHGMTSADIV